jgi:hypothetical protein
MANKHKGEVEFTADGTTFKLVYSTNALCELEGVTGEPAIVSFASMGDPAKARISLSRAMFWAGLRDHHSELSLADAGTMMTSIGLQEANRLIGEAVSLAFPVPEASSRPLAEPASQSPGTGNKS